MRTNSALPASTEAPLSRRLVVAAAIAVGAALLRLLMGGRSEMVSAAPFLAAAFFGGLRCGPQASILCVTLCTLGTDYFFPTPPGTLAIASLGEWASVAVVAAAGVAAAWVAKSQASKEQTLRSAEGAVRASEQRQNLVFDAVRDYAVVFLDPDGRVTCWSAGARQLFGYGADEMLGRPLSTLVPDDQILRGAPQRDLARAAETNRADAEGPWMRKDRSTFRAHSAITPTSDEGAGQAGFLAVIRDLGGESSNDDLRLSLERARSLTEHLYIVREGERSRIAREMHDELGQSLTCLKMDLAFIAEDFSEGRGELSERIRVLRERVDAAIQSMRRLVTELRPRVLDDLGLAAAVEWQSQEFQTRTGIRCRFADLLPEISLDRNRSNAMFRVFQEALTNVARHSAATEVIVLLKDGPEAVVLEVQDNGRGITDEEFVSKRSMGLLSMRERILVYGGTVEIAGRPGDGTKVRVVLPREAEKNDPRVDRR